jgi:hypothetical protein
MITGNAGQVLEKHVTLDVEGIDRLYLNAYQPLLQMPGGVVRFFKQRRGAQVASTTLMAPMTRAFVCAVEDFARAHRIETVRFTKGQRKDDVTRARLRGFAADEGVVYIGVAQEKFSAFRMRKRVNPRTGSSYGWLYRSTVMCNQYYFYVVDADFGPLFIKISSYFPFTARVCLNGHEYAKRQLAKEGIGFEPLDNGVLSCADPKRLQEICDQLDAGKLAAVVGKWLARLPQPFTPEDQAAGYRYRLSILQAEFARTQVFERPLAGRVLFEQIVKENIDLGRPEQVGLIFHRRITKKTPGRFASRIITQGVIPSLHVGYKNSRIKQYLKEGRALRTETTVNNTRDFSIGRRLDNLPALRAIGFAANRRLLAIEKLSQDCQIGQQTFEALNQPRLVNDQRAPALRFGDPRAMALFHALCLFALTPDGFSNATLRPLIAQFLPEHPTPYGPAQMTYDLRRLRLHGLIERLPGTRRYQPTQQGRRICIFLTKAHARVLRPGLTQITPQSPRPDQHPLSRAMQSLDRAVETLLQQAKIAARNLPHSLRSDPLKRS